MDLSQEGNSEPRHHHIEVKGDSLKRVAFDAAVQACKEGLPEHLMDVKRAINGEGFDERSFRMGLCSGMTVAYLAILSGITTIETLRKDHEVEAAQKEINESLKKSIGNLGSFVTAVQFVQAKFNLNKHDAEKAVEIFIAQELR